MKALRPSVADAFLKTSRAKVHLDSLRHELDLFYKSHPYCLIGEDDIERQRYRLRAEITDTPDPIPLILGDLFYCLRSSLDQLVWWLAKLTTPYPEGTQFPIIEKDIAIDKDAANRFAKLTTGVPAGAVEIIKSLQPYHGGNSAAIQNHLLWRLNLLCNIDKHWRIPVHGDTAEFSNVFPLEAGPFIERENEDIVSVPIRFKSQVNLNPDASFKVVFGDLSAGIACDFDGIENIYNFVADDVIPRFARFFQ